MNPITSKVSKPVRAVVQSTGDPRIEAELRDLNAGQKHLLDVLQQLGARRERRDEIGIRRERSPEEATDQEYGQAGSRYRESSRDRERDCILSLRA